jgi:hypothetical protein
MLVPANTFLEANTMRYLCVVGELLGKERLVGAVKGAVRLVLIYAGRNIAELY